MKHSSLSQCDDTSSVYSGTPEYTRVHPLGTKHPLNPTLPPFASITAPPPTPAYGCKAICISKSKSRYLLNPTLPPSAPITPPHFHYKPPSSPLPTDVKQFASRGQSCSRSLELSRLYQPLKSYRLMRRFLLLWKRLQLFKFNWAQNRYDIEEVNTAEIYKNFQLV